MSNRETYPASFSPIAGDVVAGAGATQATVTGIQSQPVDPTVPTPQQILVYGSDGVWHPEDPIVSGTDAPGTPSTKNPVQVAGIDDSQLVREFLTDSQGSLRSISVENLLTQILYEIRATKYAIIALDKTLVDKDFDADNFEGV